MHDDSRRKFERIRDSIEDIGQRSKFLATRLEATRARIDLILSDPTAWLRSDGTDETAHLDEILDHLLEAQQSLAWGGYPRAKTSLRSAEDALTTLLRARGADS